MAKITGFLEFDRELPRRRPVPVRLRDWREVYEPFGEQSIRNQAARCMDCGIPFCHEGCPLGNLIPEWNDLVYRDDWFAAIERLHATNNFPEFTGRLCPAPCEGSCVLGINSQPVTIKQVEVEIIERAFQEGWVDPVQPRERSGRRVAIVGSGPAGLACAQQLARAGYSVVVFERAERPGGLLRYGIPEFKMEKRILDRRLQQLRREGVEFRCATAVGLGFLEGGRDASAGEGRDTASAGEGRDTAGKPGGFDAAVEPGGFDAAVEPGGFDAAVEPGGFDAAVEPGQVRGLGSACAPEVSVVATKDLQRDFDALVLAGGATNPRDLNIPGRKLGGVHFAMDYLKRSNLVREGALAVSPIDAADKRVVILGGGDTGADCLGTAHRQGARSIHQIEIMPRPPDERTTDNPWPAWPLIFRTSSAHEEGGERVFSVTTAEFVDDGSGSVRALRGHEVEMITHDGRSQFVAVADTEFEIECELVLLALGFTGAERHGIVDELGLDLDARGSVACDSRWSTNVEGVFVCGDMTRGQSLIVWAIAEGRSAAAAVDRWLSADTELPAPLHPGQLALR